MDLLKASFKICDTPPAQYYYDTRLITMDPWMDESWWYIIQTSINRNRLVENQIVKISSIHHTVRDGIGTYGVSNSTRTSWPSGWKTLLISDELLFADIRIIILLLCSVLYSIVSRENFYYYVGHCWHRLNLRTGKLLFRRNY